MSLHLARSQRTVANIFPTGFAMSASSSVLLKHLIPKNSVSRIFCASFLSLSLIYLCAAAAFLGAVTHGRKLLYCHVVYLYTVEPLITDTLINEHLQ
jgi:hypothetical protein